MHLTPREQERLTLFTAAELARRRLARGALLGAPDAIAYVCDEILEWAWDGVELDEIVRRAGELLTPDRLQPGVAAAVPAIQVEALFPHGSALVHVPQPFGPPGPGAPGSVRAAEGEIELAAGREHRVVTVHNSGHRAVWISSHFPLHQLNPAVRAETDLTGYRLAIPAGTAVRLGPGERRQVTVVAVGGRGGAA
ncbi:urease subunit gamma [Prauserella muralis]|uniref:urease n=1 Tax=Prauserella muralis TaxID=588067 RepID=A0A2V4B7H2_9PSEU|nr:urease subunit gamma [Prauserella muralis]PXY31096.1 urease subunit gamma [Prauserella muralis]TWE14619.1 urease subunit gamma/beta [Prauserella muralis]